MWSAGVHSVEGQRHWVRQPNPFCYWNRAGPCGAPGHKSLSVPPISLITGNRLHSASKTFPELQWGRFKQLLIREGRGCRDQGGTVKRETIVQPWGRVLVPPQEIHRTISSRCFTVTETPARREKLTVCCPQARRPETGGTRRLMMPTPNYLTTNQSGECPQADHALFEPRL